MLRFNEKVQEDTGMRIIDLLPKKVKRMIYRHQHQDKYKAALLMMKALRKDPDVISRGYLKIRIKAIAADHFGLNHREFDRVLDRKTRYEEKSRDPEEDEGYVEEYLTEGTTTASTYFEQVIVACANAKDIEEVKAAPGYAEWMAAAKKDRKWKTDDTTLDNFRKQIQRIR